MFDFVLCVKSIFDVHKISYTTSERRIQNISTQLAKLTIISFILNNVFTKHKLIPKKDSSLLRKGYLWIKSSIFTETLFQHKNRVKHLKRNQTSLSGYLWFCFWCSSRLLSITGNDKERD